MKQLEKLTKRQKFILEVIERLGKASNKEILEQVNIHFDKSSRITVVRDINALLKEKFLKRFGNGRSITYASLVLPINRIIDAENYFKKEPDERIIKNEKIDFRYFEQWHELFTKSELEKIKTLTVSYQKRLSSYNSNQIKKELERITIEFAWKSSHIEGNTYTLLDTERLIKQHEESKDRTHSEAVMILNHKNALEYAWGNSQYFRTISPKKIEEIHFLISHELGIAKGLRKKPVGIVGTSYKPYDNIFQIKEAVEELCELINSISDPFEKALISVAGLSYIQPFEDGNKRTSRLIGNAILMAHQHCPLSYRSIDEIEYKKAVILFYEQHSLFLLKKLFIEQYEFAVNNYFC